MRLIFSPLDKFWVNNSRTVIRTSVISNFFSVTIFKIRLLSVFQEFFYRDFFGCCRFFLLVSVLCFRNLFLNLDLLVLWSSWHIGSLINALVFFFLWTWRLNILKTVFLYIPKSSTLEVAVTISYLNLALSKFYFSVNKCLVLVSEIPFWIQLLSKDGSLRGLFQKYCCAGIDWPGLWVGLSGFLKRWFFD